MAITVLVELMDHARELGLPEYQTEGSAAMDLRAAVDEEMTINPGQTVLVPTGLKIALPRGYELQIRPRSGLALKNNLTILNSPGTIDSDYRGEVKIILSNFGDTPFVVERGMRVCQALLAEVARIEWQTVSQVPETERGEGGFGHTGV
jgi:dUTP pyrophosphatase